MGLDPISIIASIATNFATNILKHHAQYLDDIATFLAACTKH
jgi:hypothetical protein